MAGVAAEPGAGEDAEALQPKGLGYDGHQAIQLQPGGVWISQKLGLQEQFPTKPGKVGGWHLEVSGFCSLPVTQGAVDLGKTIGPPGSKMSGCARQDYAAHMCLTLLYAHHFPGQTLTVRTHGTHPLRIARHEPQCDKGQKYEGYDSCPVNDRDFSFSRVNTVTAQIVACVVRDYTRLSWHDDQYH